ncbi:MAG TPA: 2'-deoxycytidine 5'-triphosphate deaminase, partial [Hyphomicrobium sp.]|nr:2'-deoxycytidine 5'-triphosphate deaminase [Hyphomicrobium sp.]
AGVVNVSQVGAHPIRKDWDEIYDDDNGRLVLDPNEFYILASKESVVVPPRYAAEMAPIDPVIGEYRVHYAGFFDPGFGIVNGRTVGSKAVLEVRSLDIPFVLEDGQIIGRLVYEKLLAAPSKLYGQGLKSNYQGQGLKLSKHFK